MNLVKYSHKEDALVTRMCLDVNDTHETQRACDRLEFPATLGDGISSLHATGYLQISLKTEAADILED